MTDTLDTDFLVASYPRSGNTWLRLILRHLFGVPSLSLDYGAEGGREQPYHGPLSSSMYPKPGDQGPKAWKTHRLPSELPALPAIVVYRHPIAATISYARWKIDARGWDSLTLRQAIDRLVGDGDNPRPTWLDFHKAWLRELYYSCFISYEALYSASDPAVPVQRAIAAAMGTDTVLRTWDPVPSFEALRSENPTFYRRGLPEPQAELLTANQIKALEPAVALYDEMRRTC